MSSQGKVNKDKQAEPALDGGVYYGFAPVDMAMASLSTPVPKMPATPVLDLAALARQEAGLGLGLYNQGRFQEAAARFVRALQYQPRNAEYHYRYACAAWESGDTSVVEKHLQESLNILPSQVHSHQALTLWYLQQDQCDKALKHAQAVVALAPQADEAQICLAEALIAIGRYAEADAILKPLVSQGRGGLFMARTVGKLAMKAGNEAAAVEIIKKALATQNPAPREKVQLHAALSPLLEKVGRYDEAFAHARLLKDAVRPAYEPRNFTQNVSECSQYFTRDHLAALPRASHGNSRPVFIVGMPRSGTSLVEQILASHSEVFGAGELSRLSEMIQPSAIAPWSNGRAYPYCFDNLSVRSANQMADEYLKIINAMNSSATYVTDKMPQNYLHLGAAQILFPQCKVIHCVRDPRDTCLSCYMTTFLVGQEFSHDLSHIARYYRDYERIMAHWKTTLDLPILDVRYEDVVADQEGQTRRMLEFLGLPWEPNCLNFQDTRRSVLTASRDQVRKPIYHSSVGRWKNYEKHIPELLALAAPATR